MYYLYLCKVHYLVNLWVINVTKHSVISRYCQKRNSWIKMKTSSLCSKHIMCSHCYHEHSKCPPLALTLTLWDGDADAMLYCTCMMADPQPIFFLYSAYWRTFSADFRLAAFFPSDFRPAIFSGESGWNSAATTTKGYFYYKDPL